MPEKLKPTDRDNTIVKKRKEEVVDVLAEISKAASFVDQIVQKETPNMNSKSSSKKVQEVVAADQEVEAEEDNEAEEI